ncbi:MAG TPA: histidine phosphatase family protein [Sporolactobacillaceae bacterium]|nr:histidine phosphatase family protein [Sporolactobacillaceae bacterium]
MSQKIFLIRHCQATGQEPEARLTENGKRDSLMLAQFLQNEPIEAIYCSPFARAIETAAPLAKNLNLTIKTDNRLKERTLSRENLSDWFERLKATFSDFSVKYAGGESSQEAMNRAVHVVEGILDSKIPSAAVVTHGNLMSLILHHFDQQYGFETWKALTNPDVYLLNFQNDDRVLIKRLWC